MAFFIYIAQVSLYALVMWGIYFIVWRNKPLHTYSRMYLLSSLILPAILPFIHIPVSEQSAIAAYSVTLPEVSLAPVNTVHTASHISWLDMLAWGYVSGAVLFAALYIRAYVRIFTKLSAGRSVKRADHTIITNTTIGPGTLGRWIFFPNNEIDDVIVQHELAHISAGHRYDSFLLQALHVIFWMSPAHWLIGQELKAVHEFEADKIASKGVDTEDYASLLLSQSLSAPQPFAIAHSFFRQPLKRRIMMLQKIKTPKRSILLVAALVLTIGFMSTVLLAKPGKSGKTKAATTQPKSPKAIVDMDVVMRNQPPKNAEIKTLSDGAIAFKTVDKMPQFNGNMRDWLVNHMDYTDSAKAKVGDEHSVVQFTVSENGQVLRPHLIHSSGDARLDAEAVRLVGNMPAWKPGLQKGNPVPVVLTLPISFRPYEGC